jgi:hypothetical protein
MSQRLPFVITAKAVNPVLLVFPGFRVALAIAGLPGMTIQLCNELLRHITLFSVLKNFDRWLLKDQIFLSLLVNLLDKSRANQPIHDGIVGESFDG